MKSVNNMVVLALLGNTEAIETLRKKQEVKPYGPTHDYLNWGFNQVKVIDEDPDDTAALRDAEVNAIKAKVSERQDRKLKKARMESEYENAKRGQKLKKTKRMEAEYEDAEGKMSDSQRKHHSKHH